MSPSDDVVDSRVAALPSTPDRVAQEITLAVSLARGLLALRGTTKEFEDAYGRVLEMLDEAGSLRQLYPVLINQAKIHQYQGGFAKRRWPIGRSLLKLAEQADDDALRADAHLVTGSNMDVVGEPAFTLVQELPIPPEFTPFILGKRATEAGACGPSDRGARAHRAGVRHVGPSVSLLASEFPVLRRPPRIRRSKVRISPGALHEALLRQRVSLWPLLLPKWPPRDPPLSWVRIRSHAGRPPHPPPRGRAERTARRLRRAGLLPQGRFVGGARAVDGALLEQVDPYGKHLFCRFASRPSVHVHLGMAGRFVLGERTAGGVIPAARLRLEGAQTVVHLIAPVTCELLEQSQAGAITSALGQDPLRNDADPERAIARIARSGAPIGSVLLDQSVIAGIGNVLRAEILYLLRIHPSRFASSLTDDERERLWRTTVELMRASRDRGRIISRVPTGVPDAAIDEIEGRFVYKRHTCAACETPVEAWTLAGRTAYACPRCQAA